MPMFAFGFLHQAFRSHEAAHVHSLCSTLGATGWQRLTVLHSIARAIPIVRRVEVVPAP